MKNTTTTTVQEIRKHLPLHPIDYSTQQGIASMYCQMILSLFLCSTNYPVCIPQSLLFLVTFSNLRFFHRFGALQSAIPRHNHYLRFLPPCFWSSEDLFIDPFSLHYTLITYKGFNNLDIIAISSKYARNSYELLTYYYYYYLLLLSLTLTIRCICSKATCINLT